MSSVFKQTSLPKKDIEKHKNHRFSFVVYYIFLFSFSVWKQRFVFCFSLVTYRKLIDNKGNEKKILLYF